MERALMTGITRVSKESVFSDLNNLNVVTVTSDEYTTAFGFTEKEVFDALDEAGLSEEKALVKSWYDGFVFGQCKDMYNPWSITNFLDKRELQAYWADTCSNRLLGRLIQTASGEIKEKMEILLEGTQVVENFNEQIVFKQLDHNESAIWSLLLASGYLEAVEIEYRGIYRKPWFHLAITNMETEGMFAGMFRGWFSVAASNYNGFVFGLIAELADEYEIHSNRESGFGRYDVMMIPRDWSASKKSAIIMEFKVYDAESEQSLEGTVKAALAQIEEKAYDAELTTRGIASENIRHYGFAFEGKKVLIG
ncbi:ATP-binding protein [bacterium]|nr:ATP-binding protein [bacterium]